MKGLFFFVPLLLVGCSSQGDVIPSASTSSTQNSTSPASTASTPNAAPQSVTLETPPPVSSSSITTAAEVNSILTDELARARQNHQEGKMMQLMTSKSFEILDGASSASTAKAVKEHWVNMRTQTTSLVGSLGTPSPDVQSRTEVLTSMCRWIEVAADAKAAQLGEGVAPTQSYEEAKTQSLAFATKSDLLPTPTPFPTEAADPHSTPP